MQRPLRSSGRSAGVNDERAVIGKASSARASSPPDTVESLSSSTRATCRISTDTFDRSINRAYFSYVSVSSLPSPPAARARRTSPSAARRTPRLHPSVSSQSAPKPLRAPTSRTPPRNTPVRPSPRVPRACPSSVVSRTRARARVRPRHQRAVRRPRASRRRRRLGVRRLPRARSNRVPHPDSAFALARRVRRARRRPRAPLMMMTVMMVRADGSRRARASRRRRGATISRASLRRASSPARAAASEGRRSDADGCRRIGRWRRDWRGYLAAPKRDSRRLESPHSDGVRAKE